MHTSHPFPKPNYIMARQFSNGRTPNINHTHNITRQLVEVVPADYQVI